MNDGAGTVPFELRYSLPRRWTLWPHIRLWGPFAVLLSLDAVVLLVLLLVLALARPESSKTVVFFAIPLLFVGWFGRNFFRGIVNGLRPGTMKMVLRVEEKALGVGTGDEQIWMFLDGLQRVERLRVGLWTLSHFNGTVLHIPEREISEAQLAHLRAATVRGSARVPDGRGA